MLFYRKQAMFTNEYVRTFYDKTQEVHLRLIMQFFIWAFNGSLGEKFKL